MGYVAFKYLQEDDLLMLRLARKYNVFGAMHGMKGIAWADMYREFVKLSEIGHSSRTPVQTTIEKRVRKLLIWYSLKIGHRFSHYSSATAQIFKTLAKPLFEVQGLKWRDWDMGVSPDIKAQTTSAPAPTPSKAVIERRKRIAVLEAKLIETSSVIEALTRRIEALELAAKTN